MYQDVNVVSPDGTPVSLEQCMALYSSDTPEGGSQREYSTLVYCSDDWEPITTQKPFEAITTLDGTTVTRFELDSSLVRSVSDQIFGSSHSVKPITSELGEELAVRVSAAVSSAINVPGRLKIRSRLKPIASNPATSHMTGGTTDGLHLDAAQAKEIFRVGFNLGQASRYVICGLTSLAHLGQVLGEHVPDTSVTHAAKYDYSRLIGAGLHVARFEVPVGYGWLMLTTKIPHDGRRANPQLPSRFVLMEAEVI